MVRLKETVGPRMGDTAERRTVPAKPKRLVRAIVEIPGVPKVVVIEAGLAEMAKSAKVKVALAEWISWPMVPEMLTVKVPLTGAVQVRLAIAGDGGKVTLVGIMGPQVRPVGPDSLRATVPVKPLRKDTAIEETEVEPAFMEAGDVALMAKSAKVKVADVGSDREPIVPVIVTMKLPADADLHDNVAVPGEGGRMILPRLVQVRPLGTVSVKTTAPERPLTLAMMIVELAGDRAFTEAGEVAVILKSTKWKTMRVAL